MVKSDYFVINIDSFSISLYGIRIINKNVARFYQAVQKHSGLKNNFFKNPEELYYIMTNLVEDCRNKSGKCIDKIYLILPQRFFRTKYSVEKMMLSEDKFINKFDLEELIKNSYRQIEDCLSLTCTPIAYKIDEEYIDNPIGLATKEIELIASTTGILAKVYELFIDMSKKINATFVFEPIMNVALKKLQKDYHLNRSSRVVILFNESSINVCYCEMNAVIAMKTIELGQSDIVKALSAFYGINEISANELYKHVNFNLQDGNYIINNGEIMAFDTIKTNNCVEKVIDILFQEIKNAIDAMIGNITLNIYMFGSNLCEKKGVERMMVKKMEMPISVLKPKLLLWNTSADYALVGLIESILLNAEDNNG